MFEVRSKKKEWNAGRRTTKQIIAALKASYMSLSDLKQWDQLDSSSEQIIALTTQIGDLKRQNMTKGKGGGKGNDAKAGGSPPKNSKHGQASK